MKKLALIAFFAELPCIPLLIRAVKPDVFNKLWLNHPLAVVLIIITIDGLLVSLLFSICMTVARLLSRIRAKPTSNDEHIGVDHALRQRGVGFQL